jgi:glycine betaine catabolism A
VRSAVTQPAVTGSLLRTLPGRYYTDPEVFAQEQRMIFERMWVCAIRADEIAGPGAFRTVKIGDESVIIVRNKDGELRAFLNVCRHRGARICAETEGHVRRNLRCAYHAWTYDLDGRLVAAPNLVTMPDVDRDAYGLIKAHLREWLGYAWVCVAQEPPSFEETVIADVTRRLGDATAIDSYRTENLKVGRRITYDVQANWKLIIENFMECYHCATIHPELTRVLPEFAKGYAAQYYVGHGAEFAGWAQAFTVTGEGGFGRLPSVAKNQERRYFAVTVLPQVFLNLVPDHVIAHRMFPVTQDRTTVVCDWLFDAAVVDSQEDISNSVELFDRVNRQDFAACELTQLSMGSRAYRDGGVLVPSEHHIAQFHDWVTAQILRHADTTCGAWFCVPTYIWCLSQLVRPLSQGGRRKREPGVNPGLSRSGERERQPSSSTGLLAAREPGKRRPVGGSARRQRGHARESEDLPARVQ